MSTTTLFIEHLITGLQAGLWLAFLVLSIFVHEKFSLEWLKGYEALASALAIAVIYPLGVFIDNLADDLFKRWNTEIRSKYLPGESFLAMEVLTRVKDNFLSGYFGYIRTRIRICRSAAVNFVLLTITSVLYTAIRLRTLSTLSFWKLIVFELAGGLALTYLAAHSWHRITTTFAKQLARASELGEANKVALNVE